MYRLLSSRLSPSRRRAADHSGTRGRRGAAALIAAAGLASAGLAAAPAGAVAWASVAHASAVVTESEKPFLSSACDAEPSFDAAHDGHAAV